MTNNLERASLPTGVPTRARLEELYKPSAEEFSLVNVPKIKYFMVDGEGDPHSEPGAKTIEWLFASVYPIKRIAKERLGKHFVEPPLEALWWADNVADFIAGNKAKLKWRMMIPAPRWATKPMFAKAVAETAKRLGKAPKTLRLESYDEGQCVQIMYVGPPAKENATLVRLHRKFLPTQELVPNGPHHEIYLTDSRRTAPRKSKIVLRQPVRSTRRTQSKGSRG